MGALLAGHVPELLILAFLLGCSAFFSGSETALFSLTRERLRGYERQPGSAGPRIIQLLSRPKMLLATILIGNTVVNVLFYSVSFRLAQKSATVSPWAGGVIGVASLFLVIVFGEVSPKSIAVGHPEGFARLAVVPLYWFSRAARPAAAVCVAIVRVVTEVVAARVGRDPYVNADELKMLVDLAAKQRVLDHGERAMIQAAVDVGVTRVKQIMVPRVDMALFQIDAGRDKFLRLVRASRHTCYPVYTRSVDDIAGALLTRDVLLNPNAGLHSLVRPATFVPETKTVESLLRQFREQRLSVAIVVDEYGGTSGMVTIEDVIEEIVGEIQDEYDRPTQDVVAVTPDVYLLSGNVSVEAWRDMFGLDLPTADVDTLGGMVAALLGRVPNAGDSVKLHGLELTVETMRRRRVERVRLRLLPLEEREGAEP